MTCFRGAQVCTKWLQGKSDDELIQPDNKIRIGTRSGKFRIVENPELAMNAWWQSMTRAPMTTSMIAWYCMTRSILWELESSYFLMVLWYGRSCKEMCGEILWAGQQDDATTLQSIYSLHWWPTLQRGRIEICWRIVTSMLPNCSEMLILGTNWTTWYSVVSE